MDVSKLAKVDLNLLVALHVLIEERSVSRAATRLHVTQPAMSKTLNRLRDTFDDPLFARSNRGIQPTPRAEALANELINVLSDIEGLLDAGEFSPQAFRGEIVIAISEYVGFTLLPSLTARLETRAPKLKLRTITRAEQQLDLLADGRLDFAIQLSRNSYPSEFRHHELASSPLAVFVRRDHPLTQQPINEDNLRLFPQINLYIADRAEIDDADLPPSEVLGAALYLGLVPSALCGYLQTIAQKTVPPSSAAVVYATDPLWAAFFAYFALHERLGPAGLAGAALIAAAAFGQNLLLRDCDVEDSCDVE